MKGSRSALNLNVKKCEGQPGIIQMLVEVPEESQVHLANRGAVPVPYKSSKLQHWMFVSHKPEAT
jgi:hypothetical protein